MLTDTEATALIALVLALGCIISHFMDRGRK